MSSAAKWNEEAMNSTNKWDYDHNIHYDTSTGTGLNMTLERDRNEYTRIERKSPRQLDRQRFSIYESEQKRAYTAKQQTVDLTYTKPHNKKKEKAELKVKKPPVWGQDRPRTEEEEEEQAKNNTYNKGMWTTTTRDAHQQPAFEYNEAKTFNDNARKYDDMHKAFLQKVAEIPQRLAKMPPKTTKEELHSRIRSNYNATYDPLIQYKDEQLRGKTKVGGAIKTEKNTSTILRKEDTKQPPRYTKTPGLFETTNHHMMKLQEKVDEEDEKRMEENMKTATTREALRAREKEGKTRAMETTMSAAFNYDEEKIRDKGRDFTDPKYRRPQVFKRGIHGERKLSYYHKPGIGGVEMGTTIKLEDELDDDQ
mmetsp:Transcript_12377/g.18497  ORF Transcript_12377/g.18497 Transcript_12377/m.18497 type:complete len:366 (+) Transcript_12377:106-1203(+)